MSEKLPAVYILANKARGTIYTGVTGDLPGRVWLHKKGAADGFTRKYGVKRLVYYEMHGEMSAAIAREKQIKKWLRAWKIALVEKFNPRWRDLYPDIAEG